MAVKSLLLLLIISASHYAQQSRLSESVNKISSYIASEEFSSLSNHVNQIGLIDTLYSRSLLYNNNDVSEALLS
jgi:hypothetical protein